MADLDRNIKVTFSGVDKLTKVAENVTRSMSKFQRKNKEVLSDLTSQGNKAAIALAGLSAGVVAVTNSFGKLEGASKGFARAFGTDVRGNIDVLRSSTQGIISDFDLLSAATKASALGVSNDINEVAAVFEVARLRGREFGISFSDSIDLVTRGIGRMSPKILDDLGIFIPEALKEAREGMTETEMKQALLNAVLKDGVAIAEQYGEVTLTTAEKLERAKAQAENLKNTIGSALVPVIDDLTRAITPTVQIISSFIAQNTELVRKIVIGTAAFLAFRVAIGAVSSVVNGVVGGVKLLATAIGTLGVGIIPVIGIVIAFGVALARQFKQFVNIKEVVGKATSALEKWGKSGKSAASNISKGVDEAAEKIRDIKEQIQEETDSFNDQLADIVRNANERISVNKKTLKEERDEFEKNRKQREEAYFEERDRIKKSGEEQIQELEAVVARRLATEKNLTSKERRELRNRVINAKLQLQEQLKNAEETFEEETKSEVEQYEERSNELQAKIDKDTAMLEKHADDIKDINLDIQKDEIDILKETHRKRLAELNKQLDKEVEASRSAADDIFAAFDGSIADINALEIDWNDVLNFPTFNQLLGGILASVGEFKKGFLGFFISLPTMIASVLGGKGATTLTQVDNEVRKYQTKVTDVQSQQLKKALGLPTTEAKKKTFNLSDKYIKPFAAGTPFVRNDQIAQIHKGEAIIPAEENPFDQRGELKEIKGNGGNTFNNTFVNTYVDPNVLAGTLAFQLNTLGRR